MQKDPSDLELWTRGVSWQHSERKSENYGSHKYETPTVRVEAHWWGSRHSYIPLLLLLRQLPGQKDGPAAPWAWQPSSPSCTGKRNGTGRLRVTQEICRMEICHCPLLVLHHCLLISMFLEPLGLHKRTQRHFTKLLL